MRVRMYVHTHREYTKRVHKTRGEEDDRESKRSGMRESGPRWRNVDLYARADTRAS